jgi:hypothetical protein
MGQTSSNNFNKKIEIKNIENKNEINKKMIQPIINEEVYISELNEDSLFEQILMISNDLLLNYNNNFLKNDFCNKLALIYQKNLLKLNAKKLKLIYNNINSKETNEELLLTLQEIPKNDDKFFIDIFSENLDDSFWEKYINIDTTVLGSTENIELKIDMDDIKNLIKYKPPYINFNHVNKLLSSMKNNIENDVIENEKKILNGGRKRKSQKSQSQKSQSQEQEQQSQEQKSQQSNQKLVKNGNNNNNSNNNNANNNGYNGNANNNGYNGNANNNNANNNNANNANNNPNNNGYNGNNNANTNNSNKRTSQLNNNNANNNNSNNNQTSQLKSKQNVINPKQNLNNKSTIVQKTNTTTVNTNSTKPLLNVKEYESNILNKIKENKKLPSLLYTVPRGYTQPRKVCNNDKCELTKKEICQAISENFIVRNNIIAAILTTIPQKIVKFINDEKTGLKKEKITYEGGISYQKFLNLETCKVCVPYDFKELRKSTDFKSIIKKILEKADNLEEKRCKDNNGYFFSLDQEDMEILAKKIESSMKTPDYIKINPRVKYNIFFIQFKQKLKKCYFDNINALIKILESMNNIPIISNNELNIISIETKKIIDKMYSLCHYYYVYGIISLINVDISKEDQSQNNIKNLIESALQL